jgi:glucokinase
MGTGLGVGFLFSKTSRNPQSRSFHIIATEGGHAIASVPATACPYHDDDLSLLRYASEKLYAGAHGIEWEDVCSGRGLVLTYNWVCERAGVPAKDWSAHQISQASMAEGAERDAHAAKAMLFHYRFLFMAIQQLAIITQCSGVILAGDNQYNNHKFVVENLDVLRKTFEHHPHSKWLENTTIYLPKGIQNINIHGALHVAHTLATIGHL